LNAHQLSAFELTEGVPVHQRKEVRCDLRIGARVALRISSALYSTLVTATARCLSLQAGHRRFLLASALRLGWLDRTIALVGSNWRKYRLFGLRRVRR